MRAPSLDGLRHRDLRVPAVPAPRAAVIEAERVTVAYGANRVIDDVSLAVRAGELLALVGPNGAGKSTLLGVLAGDHAPATGTVRVDGATFDTWSSNELAVRRGVLLQQVDVAFPFTVTEVVRLGRAPWAGTPAEVWDDAVVAGALADADMAHFAGRVYNSLSGGERARAALARVLSQEAVALLLDEPTASLDVRHQELALRVARHRARRGDAVVVVLHDLDLAAAYADVAAVLSAGRIVAHGAPAEVFTPDLLSAVYEHRIDVFAHPRTGELVVRPERGEHP